MGTKRLLSLSSTSGRNNNYCFRGASSDRGGRNSENSQDSYQTLLKESLWGGPYGAGRGVRVGVVFSMQCPDKYVFDILDRDDNVLNKVTIEDLLLVIIEP